MGRCRLARNRAGEQHLVAICDRRYYLATKLVVGGGKVLSSPPLTAGDVQPKDLEVDILYLDLHGDIGLSYLKGRDGPALGVDTIERADLGETVVIATSCYLPETVVFDALRQSRALIAGGGENWGGRFWPIGAQELARQIIGGLRQSLSPERALMQARIRLANSTIGKLYRKPTKDDLAFKLYRQI